MTRYSIVYADPPWRYNDKGITGAAELQYPTMTQQELKSLNVRDICDRHCYLFLWATSPLLPEAIEVMKAWGFRYKTVAFTWVKMNASNFGCVYGMGHYTKSSTELCLLGVKGRLPIAANGVMQVIMAVRRQHSRKPGEVRERIVRLLGDLPRIELFARQKVDGWDCWGNEVESSIPLNVTHNRNGHNCLYCGGPLNAKRGGSQYCSDKYKQAAYRQRGKQSTAKKEAVDYQW